MVHLNLISHIASVIIGVLMPEGGVLSVFLVPFPIGCSRCPDYC